MTVNPAALQLYTLREQLPANRPGVLAQVAALGYGAVEPFNILSDPDGLRADLDAAGLFACSVHAVPAGEQAEDVVRAARTLGADTIIIPYLPPPRFADADGVRGVARELNELAAAMAGQGLRLGYHNHDFELSSLVGGVPALEVLADHLDDAVLGNLYLTAHERTALGHDSSGHRRLAASVRSCDLYDHAVLL